MSAHERVSATRRRLTKSLLALPVAGVVAAHADSLASEAARQDLPDPQEVLSVADFEALARAVLPPAHFGYLATGVDDDRTVSWNHEAFSLLEIRASRFVDVSRIDSGIRLLGAHWSSPVYLSAVSGERAFHPQAEAGVARAAASRSALMMLSSFASSSLEEVISARGAPVWQQLYPTDDWAVTASVVDRAQRAGCPVIAVTVDNLWGRFNETLQRAVRADSRVCTGCHPDNLHDPLRKAPLYRGLDLSRVQESSMPSAISWEFFDRLRAIVSVKLLVKGVVTGEDAAECLRRGADGVIVSNHGGRNEETLRSTIECLPEVVNACRGKIPVLLDGGIRRGTDVFKALALGAKGVGIGRPMLWGLGAFGQAGVDRVLQILQAELKLVMGNCGTWNIAAIDASYVETPDWRI